MKTLPRMLAAAVAIMSLALTGCAASSADPSDDAASASQNEPLIIFAAASLQGAFDELAVAFTAAHPEYPEPTLQYDGSQALATQIIDGADVDVIAFASEESLVPVTAAGRADAGEIFASNTLQIAVAPGNPHGIEDLADLADPALSVVLCAPEVPCGAASATLLRNAGVEVTPVSEETNVTSVVTRVASGEADAGLVYATDVAASSGALEGITPAGADDVVNRYPLAIAADAPSPQAARDFVTFVLSAEGRQILDTFGFGAP